MTAHDKPAAHLTPGNPKDHLPDLKTTLPPVGDGGAGIVRRELKTRADHHAWCTIIDAMQAFAQMTKAPGGENVIDWWRSYDPHPLPSAPIEGRREEIAAKLFAYNAYIEKLWIPDPSAPYEGAVKWNDEAALVIADAILHLGRGTET